MQERVQEKKRVIINLIKENGMLTKPQLAKILSVSLTIINRYVNELVEKGLLIEAVYDGKKLEGKPPIYYEINNNYRKLIAVYLLEDRLSILVSDNLGNVIEERLINIENRNEFTQKILYDEILKVVKELKLKYTAIMTEIGVLSIGVPGVLGEDNKISEIPSFPKLEGKNIIDFLSKKFNNIPVVVENNINLIVKALHNDYKYKRYKNLVYFFIKNNIGGGVISNGELIKGHSNLSGEFANLGIDKNYLKKYSEINSDNIEKYFIEQMKSEKKIDFLVFILLRIIVTLNPEIILIETDYIMKKEIKILNTKLEEIFNKLHLPRLVLEKSGELGEEGAMKKALEVFYSKG